MKNFEKYLMALIIMFSFTSCDDDIINLTERDRLPTSLAVAGLEGLESSVRQVYENASNIHGNNDITLYKQCGTDIVRAGTHLGDVADGGMEGMMTYSASLSPSSPQVLNLFNGLYSAIDVCNVVIQFADNFEPVTPEEENRKERAKGEAYTLRALMYLELVQRFDNVVLYTKLLEAGDDLVLEAELSSPAEVYAQIIADCKAAAAILPTRSSIGSVGIASKGMAYHIMSKAYMDLGEWGLAATAAEAVIGDSSYTLQPLNGIFGLSGGKQGVENNNEIIFSWIFTPPKIGDRANRTIQHFVPLYRLVNGLTTALDQGGRPWSRLSPSDYYWTLFEAEDGRLDAWHKRVWYYNDEPNLPSGKNLGDPVTHDDLVAQFGLDSGRPDRYLDPTTNKFFEDETYGRQTNDAEGFRNVIVYRLSEAYIIGAEAHMRNGNMPRALELINTIRERAFGNSSHNFTTLDEETILAEHAREVGHEGHRWAMLKRLGLLQERVGMYCKGIDNESITVQSHQVRWPIPQEFVDLTGVEQNPGY